MGFADGGGEFDAVHAGHIVVGQHNAYGGVLLENLQCFQAVACRVSRDALPPQQLGYLHAPEVGIVHNQGFNAAVGAQAAHHAHEVHHIIGGALDDVIGNTLQHEAFIDVFVKMGADHHHRDVPGKDGRDNFAVGGIGQVEVAKGQKVLRRIVLQQFQGLLAVLGAFVGKPQLFLEIVRHKACCCPAVFNDENFLHVCFRMGDWFGAG